MEPTSDILRRFYKEIWEDGKTNEIDKYFHPRQEPDVLIAERAVDIQEVREWMNILRSLVHGMKVTFVHTIDEGDWTSALLKISCTCKRTGNPVVVHQQIISRQINGLLAESYPQFDFVRFFEQLGQLPEDTRALLMSGTTLH